MVSAIEAFNYNIMIERTNIDNTKELFIYDEKDKFI